MSNKIAYYMLGVSGSGKSTVIKHIIKEKLMLGGNPVVKIFSHDSNFMTFKNKMMAGQWWSDLDSDADMYRQAREFSHDHKEFAQYEREQWAECLKADVLFVDTMHITRKKWTRYISEAKQKGFTVWAVSVMAPINTLINRQKTRRDKSVPESVIQDAYYNQQEMFPPDEVDYLFVVDGTKREIVLQSVVHF